MVMFLKKVTLLRNEPDIEESNILLQYRRLETLNELELTSNVTFFVGENGTGKSTLLEGIADNCGFNTAGGNRNNLYDVDAAESALGKYLRLSWMPKVTNGFFLRAESFYQFASHIDQQARENPGCSR